MVALNRLLNWMPGGVLVALSHLEIDEHAPGRLVLAVDGGQVSFDQLSGIVSFSGGHRLFFWSIQSIEIVHFINGKRFEWWILNLQLHTGKRIRIGRSTDGFQVSSAAAHAATVIGKRVLVVEGTGV